MDKSILVPLLFAADQLIWNVGVVIMHLASLGTRAGKVNKLYMFQFQLL